MSACDGIRPAKLHLLNATSGLAMFCSACVALSPTGAQAQVTTDAAVAPAPTPSQEAAATSDIIVTGSRIQREDLAAASPVSVLSGDQIALKNSPGVEEVLRLSPQAVAGVGSNNNYGSPGVATVNLRNLGAVRTLVLVDGKRFVPYDAGGIVDLNMIPSALVERVEIVTGGASAVYGSDAVAGVVNFVLKKNFTGVEGDAQTGISDRGDGNHYDFSLTGGVNLGHRGNITVNGTYSKQAAVLQGDRSFSAAALDPSNFSPGGSSTNLFGSLDTPSGRYTFTPGGFAPYSSARDSYNYNPPNLLQVPHEKWTGTALANYKLTDAIEFYARGSVGDTKVQTQLAPSGTFGLAFDVNYRTNPFLDPASNPAAAGARTFLAQFDDGTRGDKVANDGIVTVGIRRRTSELGPRIYDYHSRAWQVVSGLKGDLSDKLHWEVFGQYGKSTRDIGYLNDIDAAKTQQAILATGTFANPVCIDPSGGCVPANLFGANNLSPAAANFLTINLSEKDKNDQIVAGGFLSGDLPIELVASHPAAFVLGVEYRRESGSARPDQALIQGNSIGFGQVGPVDARLDVKEVYGEAKLPILADVPFARTLGLEAGFRYSSYQNSAFVDNSANGTPNANYVTKFNNWAFKVGGDWEPIQAVRFRAMFQRAVRAPNLAELGTPRAGGISGNAQFDPCAAGTFNASDTTLRALCQTVGGGIAAAQVGAIAQPTSGQVNSFVGGNPNLEPEVADTITIGAVFRPTTIRNFTASVDFFDIKVNKAILQTPAQAVLDACYYGERNATGEFCSLIHRNALTGSLEGDPIYGVDTTSRNSGKKTARGIDFKANYALEVGNDVRLRFGMDATWTMQSQVQFAPVLKTYECVGKVGVNCVDPQPKWVWNQTTAIEAGPALVQLTWRHLSSLENDALSVGYNLVSPTAYVVPKIPAFNYLDLAARFDIKPHMQFRLAVDNLLDKAPPVVGQGYGSSLQNSGNTYPATYDVLGRYFSAGVNVRF